jgi:hypothetical protein
MRQAFALLCLLALAPAFPGAAATASTCLSSTVTLLPAPPAGAVAVLAGANSLAGPVGPPLPCALGLTSSASPCAQISGIPLAEVPAPGGGAWCGRVVAPATISTAPMQCTAYPSALAGPATVAGLAAGWDVAGGPFGPDGNLDATDYIAGGPAGAAYATSTPDPLTGSFTVYVPPPWSGAPPSPAALAQLIVYPVVAGPAGSSATLAIGCL